ncbi:MAG: hypothetical protein J0L64_12655 [Acidobacteria bacterium]|nr:hypothetical protein [Acidobacteriota bacterium]
MPPRAGMPGSRSLGCAHSIAALAARLLPAIAGKASAHTTTASEEATLCRYEVTVRGDWVRL